MASCRHSVRQRIITTARVIKPEPELKAESIRRLGEDKLYSTGSGLQEMGNRMPETGGKVESIGRKDKEGERASENLFRQADIREPVVGPSSQSELLEPIVAMDGRKAKIQRTARTRNQEGVAT